MPGSPRPNGVAALAAAFCLAGCVAGRGWNPFAETAPALPPDATCEQVVAHLNGNIQGCTGWRSTDVSIKSNGSVLSAGAMMAVESPRRFRMLVSAMGGHMDLADLGSNDERMWFWMRPAGDERQYVETCAHTDFPAAQQRLVESGNPPLPFRPDWLMEVLGVIPIDPSKVEMRPNPGDAGQVLLVSEQEVADGTSVVRITTVDLKRGVVVGHTLWGGDGKLIAQAKLADHRTDKATGVVLPHRIELSYPAAQTEMTLAIREIEVNPTHVSPNTWLPHAAHDCPYRDLATGQLVTLDRAGPI